MSDQEVRAALVDKYARMIALRSARAAGAAADVGGVRELARRYPGALRELDRSPMDVLHARHEALHAPALPSWAQATYAYHCCLGAALSVRRAAGRDRSLPDARQAWALSPVLASLPPDSLNTLMDLPNGRISRWALLQVAGLVRLSPKDAENVIFGHLQGGW